MTGPDYSEYVETARNALISPGTRDMFYPDDEEDAAMFRKDHGAVPLGRTEAAILVKELAAGRLPTVLPRS